MFHGLAELLTVHFHLQEGFAVTAKQLDSTIECFENGSEIIVRTKGLLARSGHSGSLDRRRGR
jgi:hypothetical protein